MKKKYSIGLFVVLILSSLFSFASPVHAVNACNQRQSYDSTWCDFYADEANIPALYECQDSWGYKGHDSLWYVGFEAPGSGLITRGSKLGITLQTIQDCKAWNNAYKISVILVAENGDNFASENMTSEFLYSSRNSAPTLSYCSTSTCGTAVLKGYVNLPATSPEGKYQIKVRVTPWGSINSSDTKTFTMKGFLSTTPQPRYIPALEKVNLAVTKDGVITCYITDFVDTAVSAFSITGSNWEIYEDGLLVDSFNNYPLATSDNAAITQLKHGYMMTMFNEAANTRLYAYGVANQKIGSTYECRSSIATKFGNGAQAKASVKSTVRTLGVEVVETAPITPPKTLTIFCKKGKVVKTVRSTKPKCPSGYVKVNTSKG